MSITFKDVVKLAKGAHSLPALRSVVFDGKSAMTAAQLDWMVGVPCSQPGLTAPVVVPVEAIQAHLLKSRTLLVMPDHLTNGQGLVTPFNKSPKVDYDSVLAMLPGVPEGESVSFDLELDALDRVLIATAVHDIRYYLNGVLFDLTDGMLVATDGHRLHAYKNRVPKAYPRKLKNGAPVSPTVEVIFPRDPLHWIVASAGVSAKMTVWNAAPAKEGATQKVPQALLQAADGFVWIRKAIEGKFPDWNRVLPAAVGRPVWATINPARFADAMEAMGKTAALASKEKSKSVTVDFGRCRVYVREEAQALPISVVLNSDRVDIDLDKVADEMWIGVYAPYLQDLADCVTLDAQWRLAHENCENQSVLVVDGDFSGVVMPLRQWNPIRLEKPAIQALEAPQATTPQETAKEGQEEPETAPAEPCPAAVDAMASQLVGQVVKKAQESAKKAPRKARKPAKVAEVPDAETVAA